MSPYWILLEQRTIKMVIAIFQYSGKWAKYSQNSAD